MRRPQRDRNLVSVSLFWAKSFTEFEKIFAVLTGRPKKYKNEITISTDLLNHTRWVPNVVYKWNLFDYSTLKCDDFVINEARDGIINAYETYVIKFFRNFDSYENLEKVLNVFPMKLPPFISNFSKHVSLGLMLAHYFERQYFSSLIQEYENFSNTMHKEINVEMLDMLDKTLKFIQHNDIKALLDSPRIR